MFKVTPHDDWYEDGIEDGLGHHHEQLWRLDPPDTDIQVQLFARPAHWNARADHGFGDFVRGKPQDEWKKPRLFIEHDVRGAGNDGCGRTHYASDAFKINDEMAAKLLASGNEEAVKILKEQIDHVMGLPNQPEYC